MLPIALRNALPSLGNNFISLFKDTSIAAVIAVPELTFQARKINNESFRVIEVWLVTSLHLHRDLRADRARAAAPRSALSRNSEARDAELSQRPRLRLRRAPRPAFIMTVAVSAAAVAAGVLLGIVFGLALTYGGRLLAFPFRVVVDVVRGTPVLVLILASYYMPAGPRPQPRPDHGRDHRAHRSSAPRMSARRCAARFLAIPPAQTDAAAPSA